MEQEYNWTLMEKIMTEDQTEVHVSIYLLQL